ncbi:MAG: beta-ketoacyl synthase chain length factor [Treponema sp.]|nr:beta-ketoacyl synthase chain length factor [Treponema sp.]
MQNNFYISEPSVFAPGLDSVEDLKLFSQNKKEISYEKISPSLEYTDSLFRRRLSQLSKMTVEVVHSLIEKSHISLDTKLVFVSFRGELEREFKINKEIIESQMILPAGFSLSVFNAPVALATIACSLKAGYSAVFPEKENFKYGLLSAASSILSGAQEKIIFVYADELIPDCYKDVSPENRPPLAFSYIVSKTEIQNLKSIEYSADDISENVYDFIRLHINKCYN